MDLRSCLISLCVVVQLPLFLSAPTGNDRSSLKSAGDTESLHGIIIELENVLYKLKDYSRRLEGTDNARDDARQDYVKEKFTDEEEDLPPSKNSLPLSSFSSSSSSKEEEVSLRDAIEYLLVMAKQKKAEKRDHDIPFPLQPKQG